jgi:hypothetical protein
MSKIPELNAEQSRVLLELDNEGAACEECTLPTKVLKELETLNLLVNSGGRYVITERGERLIAESRSESDG